jgi:hypothetical protein
MALSSSLWIATEAAYRDYASAPGSDSGPKIQRALRTATTWLERILNRQVVSRGSLTEYHSLPWRPYRSTIRLTQFPILSVTSIHESQSDPRVYGADELLTVETDYQFVRDTAEVHRICGSELSVWKPGRKTVKVVYAAGWAQADVPDDLVQLACFVAVGIVKESSLGRWGVSAATDDAGNYQRFLGYLPPDMERVVNEYRSNPTGDSTAEAA